jgi:hypothetical protein
MEEQKSHKKIVLVTLSIAFTVGLLYSLLQPGQPLNNFIPSRLQGQMNQIAANQAANSNNQNNTGITNPVYAVPTNTLTTFQLQQLQLQREANLSQSLLNGQNQMNQIINSGNVMRQESNNLYNQQRLDSAIASQRMNQSSLNNSFRTQGCSTTYRFGTYQTTCP